jgi:WD40 repeat protein
MKTSIFSVAALCFWVLFSLSNPQAVTAQGIKFELAETIHSNIGEAFDVESFTIDQVHYLAVANWCTGANHSIDSKIYQWNGSNFVEIQAIPTNGARNVEIFTINGIYYLAIANGGNPDYNVNIDSKIYQWNGSSFVEIQAILTHGAADWESFSIDDEHYLVVANDNDGIAQLIDSIIYHWNGSQFEEFQRIPTNRASDWEFATIDSAHYLMVANYAGTLSVIYRWNDVTNPNDPQFVQFQIIPTDQAVDLEFFTIASDDYLVVSNSASSVANIYQWNGSAFQLLQSISTGEDPAEGLEFFIMNNEAYLVVAHGALGNLSKIYKWNGSLFVGFQTLPTNGSADWEFLSIGSDSSLIKGDRTMDSSDVNCDGAVNIFDLQVVINCILDSGSCARCDLSADSLYNIFDLQLVINRILGG